jgi:hypothetical protein
MEDLIEALQIFMKYGNPKHPTHCEHDVMYICGIDSNDVSQGDIDRLDQLGFFIVDEEDCFMSFKFGSA